MPAFNGNSPSISGFSSGGWTTSLFHQIYPQSIKLVAMGGNDRVLINHKGFHYPEKDELKWYYSNNKVENPEAIKDARVFFQFGTRDVIYQIHTNNAYNDVVNHGLR